MYNARWPARWVFKSVAGCGTGTTGTVDVRVKIVELQCVPRPAGANMTPTSYQGNAPPSHLTLQFDTGTVPPGTESVVWIVSESLNSVISDTTVYVAGNGTVEVPAPVLNDGHYDVLVEFNGLPDVDGARIGFDVWGNPGGGGGGADDPLARPVALPRPVDCVPERAVCPDCTRQTQTSCCTTTDRPTGLSTAGRLAPTSAQPASPQCRTTAILSCSTRAAVLSGTPEQMGTLACTWPSRTTAALWCTAGEARRCGPADPDPLTSYARTSQPRGLTRIWGGRPAGQRISWIANFCEADRGPPQGRY